MGKILFVTGIDTDCGKSIATGLMAKAFQDIGYKTITVKLVQSGCEGVSEDIQTHRDLMGINLLSEDLDGTTCPFVLKYPSSPHLAAHIEQVDIDLKLVQKNIEKLSEEYEIVLVEGAGGLMVPIFPDYSILDYLLEYQYPTILVSSSKLGSINHTLLSLEVCENKKIALAGLCYNHHPGENDLILNDNLQVFKRYINAKQLKLPIVELPKLELNLLNTRLIGDVEAFLGSNKKRV